MCQMYLNLLMRTSSRYDRSGNGEFGWLSAFKNKSSFSTTIKMKIELFESFQKLKILEPKAKADIELINTNDKVPHRSPFEYMKISVHATSVENFDSFSVTDALLLIVANAIIG